MKKTTREIALDRKSTAIRAVESALKNVSETTDMLNTLAGGLEAGTHTMTADSSFTGLIMSTKVGKASTRIILDSCRLAEKIEEA